MKGGAGLEGIASTQDYPAGALYVVATPIGNLADITLRALECLKRADLVAAEDTRSANHLLNQYDLRKPTLALHMHNERAAADKVIEHLERGERVAYISDAGTPAISDPGTNLVAAVARVGRRVIPIPGASALTCALSVAGLAEGPVYFAGFLPVKATQAEHTVATLRSLAAQLVFYEAPHRLSQTLEILARVLGADRRIVIARELTKLFEQVHRSSLGEAVTHWNAGADRARGEFVLIVEGAPPAQETLEQAFGVLDRLLPHMPLSEAVALCVELTGAARKRIYERALEIKRSNPDGQTPGG